MTSVLVTGAGGLIGRAVAAALRSRGHHVITSSRSESRAADHLVADLRRRCDVARLLRQASPEVVVHLAGGPSRDRVELIQRNVETTRLILEELIGKSPLPRRLIVMGSSAEYGEGSGRALTEHSPLAPVTDYGRAKTAQWNIVRVLGPIAAEQFVYVRPFNVVGPWLSGDSPLGSWRRQLKAGGPGQAGDLICGRLDVKRDFVRVGDLASLVAALVGMADPPEVLNACSGQAVVLGDLLDEAIRLSGRQMTIRIDPELANLPAAETVVGDPSLLATLGWDLCAETSLLAAELLR